MKFPAILSFLLYSMLSIVAGPAAAAGAHAAMERPQTGQHAAQQDAHAGHGVPHGDHAMESGAAQGAWSYLGRDNPKPYESGRWEMMPTPDHTFMFRSAAGMPASDRCPALLQEPRVIVDRATRAACTQADSVPPSHSHETAQLTSNEDHRHE